MHPYVHLPNYQVLYGIFAYSLVQSNTSLDYALSQTNDLLSRKFIHNRTTPLQDVHGKENTESC